MAAKAAGSPEDEPAILSLDAIVAAPDTQYELVPTPQWGGTTRIASLTGTERQQLVVRLRADEKKLGAEQALIKFVFRVVVASIVDAEGRHVADQDAAAERLLEKNVGVVQLVFDRCRVLSGLGQEELDARVADLKAQAESASSGRG